MASSKRTPRPAPPRVAGDYSLWTAPPSTWETPFQADRAVPGIEHALDGVELERHAEDERLAAYRTGVSSEVLSLPTQDRDGSPWRTA